MLNDESHNKRLKIEDNQNFYNHCCIIGNSVI